MRYHLQRDYGAQAANCLAAIRTRAGNPLLVYPQEDGGRAYQDGDARTDANGVLDVWLPTPHSVTVTLFDPIKRQQILVDDVDPSGPRATA